MDDKYDLLTKDAKYLLLNLYKMYLDRIRSGTIKSKARMFDDIPYIHENVLPQWKTDDVLDTVNELVSKEYLTARYGGDTAFFIQLKTEGVAKMENRFADSANALLEAISKLKGSIPFI